MSARASMWSPVVAVLAAAALLPLAPAPARAEDAPTVAELTPSAEAAIASGLDHLASLQNSMVGNVGDKFTVASTSLAGLAFLASGDSYERGRYGRAIAACVKYILSESVMRHERGWPPNQRRFLEPRGDQQGRMHAHGFATLFLAEAYGSTPPDIDREIKIALRGAVEATLAAQTDLGGWGYHFRGEPEFGEDEASVTITQIQALRAARNVGIYVPYDAIARALGYVKRSLTSDGSCRYSLTMQGAESKRTSYELTAAAVAVLNASGIYLGAGGAHEAELDRSLKFVRNRTREWVGKGFSPWKAATDFEFYGNLYAAQAMFNATSEDWEYWFPRVRQDLVTRQRQGGNWVDGRNFGDAYATASALLILQMPRRYLPIFQK